MSETPSRWLVLLYRLYQWLVFVPVALLATGFFAMLALALATFSRPSVASAWGGKPWARFLAAITPMRVHVQGRENLKPGNSYVIVANHLSLFDIFVLYGWLDVDFRWVMKKELRSIPGVGIACERIGHVFIDRSDRRAAIASLEKAKRRFGPSTSVVFFPEGTRGPGDRLLPFKKGAFRLAADLQAPILPVSIVGTDRINPRRSLRLWPGTATLIFHPAVAPPGPDEDDFRALIKGVRETVAGPVVQRSEG